MHQRFEHLNLARTDEQRQFAGLAEVALRGEQGDGSQTLITSLRSHPAFERSRLIVVTSLDEDQRGPYAFALAGVPVVHKPQLVAELPARLAEALPAPVASA